jgi:hypothetical protein
MGKIVLTISAGYMDNAMFAVKNMKITYSAV